MMKKTRRIAVLGFRGVGKSSLCVQFVQGKFVPDYSPTIENEYTKEVKVRGQDYKLELIDTAGQDEFSILNNQYFLDINAYILVFSITAAKTFDLISVLYDKLVDMGKQGVPIILVGNKTDLKVERVVSQEEGQRKAQEMNAMYIETTAKENEMVNDFFTKVILSMEKLDANGGNKCVIS